MIWFGWRLTSSQLKLLTTTKEGTVTSKCCKRTFLIVTDNCCYLHQVCPWCLLSDQQWDWRWEMSRLAALWCFMFAAWYQGQCRAFFQDQVCGLGQRLYIGPDGNGTCGCSEVSMRSSSPPACFISTPGLGQTRGPLLPGVQSGLLWGGGGVKPGQVGQTGCWPAVLLHHKPLC